MTLAAYRVNTEGEQLIPAGSIRNVSLNNNRNFSNRNRNQNNHHSSPADKKSYSRAYAQLIPLEKVKLTKVVSSLNNEAFISLLRFDQRPKIKKNISLDDHYINYQNFKIYL